ncbi:VCBS repeat-containing protein [Maribacter cobaltidurans]|uniref:Uncharacterized protein n=1 Tax=Maribacter cobaltidurans TaxID=1178778 RepID=A0A223V593_9FLAO|nr:VCBS repeat-containing protein [Maribacter cobaltidurans]ASV30584.1 hypothetical protein CJ263_10385 [Maribacter cobaltidurans]GGD80013.1 hypothetical protein GCM10011412_17250 [Maribacter cobaltidurans]
MQKHLIYLGLLLLSISCGKTDEDKLFKGLPSHTTGVEFSNKLNTSPELNILNYLYYYNGAGVITADFNNDGLADLYLSGNQVSPVLYINQGKMKFNKLSLDLDENMGNWNTGVTQVDINNDGFLDVYICQASGYRALKGKNRLLVNQGLDRSGNPSFKDLASEYGLDFEGLSTKAVFFDYDLDGDLDMYLLNHSVHPNLNYGKGKNRSKIDPISGDRLYENIDGHFTDVSQKAGIFQGKSGYGLGVSISDINLDGYPDVYIGNDFFENDYLYINQQDGTFKEVISLDGTKLGHTSHYSMGNAIADINNDGFPDILSLDMLPEDLQTYKTSGLEYGYPIYQQYLKNGFAPQFMQNTLHLNNSGSSFSEIGFLSGISATEWSWGPLLADFDNDGHKDLFITNGIKGATNDMDYMNFIANEDIQRRIDAGMKNTDMPLINEIPEKKASNYFFKNNGDLTFTNSTSHWFENEPSFSNGCAYADLDNDGDLDIVVNNLDDEVSILENNLKTNNFIKIKLKGTAKNSYGIGSKVYVYSSGKEQYQELFPSNNYLSSGSNDLIFGIGKDSIIDSLVIVWPDQTVKKLNYLKANQEKLIAYEKGLDSLKSGKRVPVHFYLNNEELSIDFQHEEKQTLDFNREPLVPFASSNEGPTISVADINEDGLEDFFIGGAKMQSSKLYLQNKNGTFTESQKELFKSKAVNEDVASAFFDANGDGYQDLLVASGGNEFLNGSPLKPRLYLNIKGNFIEDETAFANIDLNASKVAPFDYDNDGDLDVVLTSDQVPSQYGETPQQYFLLNDGNGKFTNAIETVVPELKNLGNIKDVKWADIDGDGLADLLVAGHWMPITIFIHDGKKLKRLESPELNTTNGWWNTIIPMDVDNDGDQDFIAGNWGTNTKFKASKEKPITLYNYDFDSNGQKDPLITYYHGNIETPFSSKDELVKQIPSLNKTFLSYDSFAKASIEDMFGNSLLKNADKKFVFELRSCLFLNEGSGKFTKQPLPLIAQASSIQDIAFNDFNNDGYKDLFVVGNTFEISTQLGRLDALHGLILYHSKKIENPYMGAYEMLEIDGAAREIKKIKLRTKKAFIVARNNDSPTFFIYNNSDE